MTREIRDILKAFKAARQEGRQTALATVIFLPMLSTSRNAMQSPLMMRPVHRALLEIVLGCVIIVSIIFLC